MRQVERKRSKDTVAIALMLCFCVIALTSIFTIRANINKINESNINIPVSDPAPTDPTGGDAEKDDPPADPDEKTDADLPAEEVSGDIPTVDSLENQPAAQEGFRFPVNGADAFVTNEFAMDHLIYSVTLDQYMAHCGVDIEAPQDTQVVAMANGTVTAIYTDDRYGNAVEINHGDCIAIYANLSDASMVEIGDTVEAGQIIGGIGTTGLFESLEPAHLHLEVLANGVYVDPMAYIH